VDIKERRTVYEYHGELAGGDFLHDSCFCIDEWSLLLINVILESSPDN